MENPGLEYLNNHSEEKTQTGEERTEEGQTEEERIGENSEKTGEQSAELSDEDEMAVALSDKLNKRRIMEAIGEKSKDGKDYEAEMLADAARRAHDEELAALANLALIRSDIENRNRRRDFGGGLSPRSQGGGGLSERIASLLRDTDSR